MNEEKPKYILLEKTEALYTLIQPMLDQFPKLAKFTLRARIEDSILDIIELLIMQNYKENDDERRKAMLAVISKIHLLNVLLHQATVFKYIAYNNYHDKVIELIKEINAIANARYKNLKGVRG